MSESNKKGVNPFLAGGIIIIAGFILLAAINSAINTPLVNGFDEAAEQSRVDACKARKALKTNGIENNEDCK